MSEQDNLALRYYGGEADEGLMGYYDTATSIFAFGDLMGLLSNNLYGERAYIRTTVKGVKEGSFGIEFILQSGGVLATMMSGPASPKDIWELFKQAIEAWRFLDGKPPQEVTRDGDQFGITNIHGEVGYFNQNVYLTVNSDKAGQAIEQFIRKPLESGRSRLELEHKGIEEKIEIFSKDAHVFTDVSEEKVILEQTTTIALTIESAVFKEGNKWRFYDGQNSFNAPVEDKEFVERVNSGERFGKGDILLVELYIVQSESKGRLKTERIIKKVKEHKVPSEQSSWF